jgi:hypothetical protein
MTEDPNEIGAEGTFHGASRRQRVKIQDPRSTIQEGKVPCILHPESCVLPTFLQKSLVPCALCLEPSLYAGTE